MKDLHSELQDVAMKLEEYTSLQNDEMGEAGHLMQTLSGYHPHLSMTFGKALLKEMNRSLATYNEYCTIVERKETVTREYRELEWNDE